MTHVRGSEDRFLGPLSLFQEPYPIVLEICKIDDLTGSFKLTELNVFDARIVRK